ncbi:hypothetical protein IAD21_06412 (plasmid) [Abditibacteriota bacterium]|nr:hypothetical protein IAD21_06412 [Abditibacteriota bacterium]
MIEANESSRKRVFISYKRSVEPDESIAMELFRALSQQHDVFIDQTMAVGAHWAQQIEAELRTTNFLVSLLSEHSVGSEMVLAEIDTAHRLGKEQAGHPAILPVRLNYREPFQYPLSAYLNPLNWAFWKGTTDTPHLIEELQRAISGGELSVDAPSKDALVKVSAPPPVPAPLLAAQPVPVELPEGAMDTESGFYIERPSDALALETIGRQGVTITIKGPRQMGKSSLLIRTMSAASDAGKRVAFLDFQLFDQEALSHADLFFRQFATWLTDQLELDDQTEEHWNKPLGNAQRCTRYVGRYLLRELDAPLVVAMDEVDSIFGATFRSDFFAMLRAWHNSRATNLLWKRLDLVLVTSTEPYQLIADLNQSPFNVGQVLELEDFTSAQVADLNHRYGSPLNPDGELQLMMLLNGHPYLTRRALYLIQSRHLSITDLLSHATDDRGPFSDHLRYHLFRMYDKKELVAGLLQVIRAGVCQNEQIFFRLRGAGLVRREGSAVVPRCRLYADYFRENLHA